MSGDPCDHPAAGPAARLRRRGLRPGPATGSGSGGQPARTARAGGARHPRRSGAPHAAPGGAREGDRRGAGRRPRRDRRRGPRATHLLRAGRGRCIPERSGRGARARGLRTAALEPRWRSRKREPRDRRRCADRRQRAVGRRGGGGLHQRPAHQRHHRDPHRGLRDPGRFRPLSPPYSITALGEPEQLRSAVSEGEAGEYLDKISSRYGIRMSWESEEELTVPARAVGTLREASVPDDGSTSTPETPQTHQPDRPVGRRTRRGGDPMIAIIGLALGIVLGVVVQPDVPAVLQPYPDRRGRLARHPRRRPAGEPERCLRLPRLHHLVPVQRADRLVPGVPGRSAWVGSQLSTAVIVVLGIRIFSNAAAIGACSSGHERRHSHRRLPEQQKQVWRRLRETLRPQATLSQAIVGLLCLLLGLSIVAQVRQGDDALEAHPARAGAAAGRIGAACLLPWRWRTRSSIARSRRCARGGRCRRSECGRGSAGGSRDPRWYGTRPGARRGASRSPIRRPRCAPRRCSGWSRSCGTPAPR